MASKGSGKACAVDFCNNDGVYSPHVGGNRLLCEDHPPTYLTLTPVDPKGPGKCCFYCGGVLGGTGQMKRTKDHVVPLSRGGPNWIGNKVLACYGCNQMKGPLTGEEFMRLYPDTVAVQRMIKRVQAQIAEHGRRPRPESELYVKVRSIIGHHVKDSTVADAIAADLFRVILDPDKLTKWVAESRLTGSEQKEVSYGSH